ncbi:hypothetical protein AVEN_15012-1 [Araneus ventricosus]|uniref:PilZ domain-containing protein n=1 Tax=Araneus ventricosus TaxID=182803 RepID=A0A4Y2FVB8_ARAVE|nr:hypothetical protein AVEN_15012-1 [Araneus ventricosus]
MDTGTRKKLCSFRISLASMLFGTLTKYETEEKNIIHFRITTFQLSKNGCRIKTKELLLLRGRNIALLEQLSIEIILSWELSSEGRSLVNCEVRHLSSSKLAVTLRLI